MIYRRPDDIQDKSGIQLEGDMIQAFMNVYNTEKVQKIYRATEYADKKEGTDFFFMLQLPISQKKTRCRTFMKPIWN